MLGARWSGNTLRTQVDSKKARLEQTDTQWGVEHQLMEALHGAWGQDIIEEKAMACVPATEADSDTTQLKISIAALERLEETKR